MSRGFNTNTVNEARKYLAVHEELKPGQEMEVMLSGGRCLLFRFGMIEVTVGIRKPRVVIQPGWEYVSGETLEYDKRNASNLSATTPQMKTTKVQHNVTAGMVQKSSIALEYTLSDKVTVQTYDIPIYGFAK